MPAIRSHRLHLLTAAAVAAAAAAVYLVVALPVRLPDDPCGEPPWDPGRRYYRGYTLSEEFTRGCRSLPWGSARLPDMVAIPQSMSGPILYQRAHEDLTFASEPIQSVVYGYADGALQQCTIFVPRSRFEAFLRAVSARWGPGECSGLPGDRGCSWYLYSRSADAPQATIYLRENSWSRIDRSLSELRISNKPPFVDRVVCP